MAKEYTPEELDALDAKGKEYSPEELDALEGKPSDVPAGFSPKRPVMSALSAVAGAIDPYSGAPTRAGIGAAMRGENPLTAAYEQFGKPSETAPSGRELSEQAGVPPSVSPYTGVAVDVLADPMNLIPGAAIGRAAKGAKGLASRALPKIGEALSGIPAKEIASFSKDYDRINKMIKEYKDAPDVAADVVRQGFQTKLQTYKGGVNKELGAALSSADASQRVSIAPVMEAMSREQTKLNPKLYGADHGAITDLQKKVLSLADEGGTVSAAEMHEIKRFLDDVARPEWNAAGQKIFSSGDKVAGAAKQGANIARKEVNKAVPAAKEANQKLSALRQIEDKMNKNLIAPGKPDSALRSAGSGGNTRGRSQLERLGKATGQDFLGDAEALAAFNRFRDLPLLPIDVTGKAGLRTGAGGALGYAAGGIPGAVAGAALTSPQAIRGGISAYKNILEPIGSVLPSAQSLYRPTLAARGIGVEERKRRLRALEGK